MKVILHTMNGKTIEEAVELIPLRTDEELAFVWDTLDEIMPLSELEDFESFVLTGQSLRDIWLDVKNRLDKDKHSDKAIELFLMAAEYQVRKKREATKFH